jgi:hypothetical protein
MPDSHAEQTREKNVDVICVFFCVFLCFCVFLSGSLADGLAIAQATSASGALQCLYGVTHAGGILTECLGK